MTEKREIRETYQRSRLEITAFQQEDILTDSFTGTPDPDNQMRPLS